MSVFLSFLAIQHADSLTVIYFTYSNVSFEDNDSLSELETQTVVNRMKNVEGSQT